MDDIYFYTLVFFLLLLFILTGRTLWVYKKKLQWFESKFHDDKKALMSKGKNSEIGMMCAGMCHEMNNLLSIVQGRAEIILRSEKRDDKNKNLTMGLHQILNSTERMAKTIQGMRRYLYAEENKNDDEEINLKVIIENILMFYNQRFKNHGIELRMHGLGRCRVIGNALEYEQVFINLFNNSFDALKEIPDKWIEISAVEIGHYLDVYFKDSGKGIPKEISAKIMDPFFTTKENKGAGLGLSFVKTTMDKHFGTFTYLDGIPNTTFLLEFPKFSKELKNPDQFRPPMNTLAENRF
jgi:C4-dicarboxylate-specific signal transduction histidine kinase